MADAWWARWWQPQAPSQPATAAGGATRLLRGWWNRWLGDRGERAAVAFLRRQGLRILVRQYRSKFGEVDVIARDGDTLVFVEVKTRTSQAAGHPADAVTPAKQAQLTRLALAFLKRYRLLQHRARFDVVAVVWPEAEPRPQIQHFRHAFVPPGHGQFFA